MTSVVDDKAAALRFSGAVGLSFFSEFRDHFSWELHRLTLGWKHLLLEGLFSESTQK